MSALHCPNVCLDLHKHRRCFLSQISELWIIQKKPTSVSDLFVSSLYAFRHLKSLIVVPYSMTIKQFANMLRNCPQEWHITLKGEQESASTGNVTKNYN